MIISNKFLFVHVPKTAGTYFRRTLNSIADIGELKEIKILEDKGSYHLPVSEVSKELQLLDRYTILRQPEKWYLSWYYHNMRLPYDPLFSGFSNNKKNSLVDTIYNAVTCNTESLLEIDRLLKKCGRANSPSPLHSYLSPGFTYEMDKAKGLYTHIASRILSEDYSSANFSNNRVANLGKLKILNTNNIGKDILSLLELYEPTICSNIKDIITKSTPVNTTYLHGTVLPEDLVSLIKSRDSDILDWMNDAEYRI